jgi:hypothetical protein
VPKILIFELDTVSYIIPGSIRNPALFSINQDVIRKPNSPLWRFPTDPAFPQNFSVPQKNRFPGQVLVIMPEI